MRRFRAQLIILMGGIVVLVIAAVVVVMLLVARYHMFDVGAREAVVRAQAFAARAAFATLVAREDPRTAQGLLREIVAAPETLGAELVDVSGARLGMLERSSGATAACPFREREARGTGQSLSHQTRTSWCVSVPVRERVSSAANDKEVLGDVIGRLRVVSSTADVERVVRHLIAWSIAAGTLMLAMAAFLVWRAARRVTDPLLEIVQTMRAVRPGVERVRAPLVGPEEIVTISRVYNALMDDIERHSAQLEAKVEQRTRELKVATEAARGTERYKSAFMSTVSHEMKTPLHVIEAHARDVLSELEFIASAESAREHLAVILDQAGELAMRLLQILALARADAGGYEVVREEFDLCDFAEDVRQRAEPLAKKNRNELEVQATGDRAYTDRDMLLQVVTNLVANACKFTEAGRVRVTIKRLAGALEVEVVDTGRGIAEAQQQMVWEEFRQADMGEARRFGGFGLGLAIVKRFVGMLGGEVQLTSEVGRGTRVLVRVPAVRT